MKRFLLTAAFCLLAALPAFAEPPGDLSVKAITIDKTDLPANTTETKLDGQYLHLANQILMVHQDAEFGVDKEAGTLLVKVPGVASAIRIEHRSDCAINSGFNVAPAELVDASGPPEYEEGYYDTSEYSNRYRGVLVAWTKSRHGVPDVPIKYAFTASNADVTLNRSALEALRLGMKNQPTRYIARN